MKTDRRRYRDDLMVALIRHDVPRERIGDVLAEIDSHTEATGEDPADAFGPPREYAAQIAEAFGAPAKGGWWSWLGRAIAESRWRDRLIWSSSLLGGVALGTGLVRGLGGLGAVWGLSPWLWAAIGALLFGGAMLVSLWRNDADPIVDPRTGTEVLPLPRPHLLLVVLWPVVAVALLAVIIRHLGA
jgi:hypothetical protein